MHSSFLPHCPVYIHHGLYNRPAQVSIYELFEMTTPTKLLLVYEEDFEFCDTLHMVFGRTPEILPIWDWHDTVWDAIHDRRDGRTMDSFFYDVASPFVNLGDIATQPHRTDIIKREEMERRKRCHNPSVYFTGSFKGSYL